MKDDEQSDSDGLDALASALPATESEEADEELDLASLAAVVGARSIPSVTDASPAEAGEKLVLGKLAEPKAPAAAVLASAPVATAPSTPTAPLPVAVPNRPRTWLVPALAAFAIGVGLMGYVLGRSSRSEDQAAVAPAAPPLSEKPAPQAAAQQAPAASAAPAPVAVAAPPPPAPEAPSTAAPSTPSSGSPSSTTGQSNARAPRSSTSGAPSGPLPVARPSTEPSPAASAPVAEPAPAKPAETAATLAKTEPAPSRSVDALLDEALSGSGARSAAPTGPTQLPEAPSRDEVTQAMAVLLPAIRGCAMGQTGLATAGIVVRGDGRVASVELSGAPFEGTASGRCMEGVLRRARFSRFSQPTFRVRFPFSIQ